MTPVEALELLDRAAAAVPCSRADHVKLVEAVNVLAAVVKPPEPPPIED